MLSIDELQEAATRHLNQYQAEAWNATLEEAIRFERGDGPAGLVVGGTPELPDGTAWPRWEHGPLSYVGRLECGILNAALPGLGLPPGQLQLYYWDARLDGGAHLVLVGEAYYWGGFGVLHIPPGTPTRPAEVPAGIEPYREVAYTPRIVGTYPAADHPIIATIEGLAGSEGLQRLYEELEGLDRPGPRHQVGGHPSPVEGVVEREAGLALAIRAAGDRRVEPTDPAAWEEGRDLVLLAQVDTDEAAGMEWGQGGRLYWMLRPGHLRGGHLDQVVLVWQT